MAQASSMQREPSMEEILASIRRIIEDNETMQKEATPEPANTSAVSSSEVASFRAELRPAADFSADSADSQDSATAENFSALRPDTWAGRQKDADDTVAPATEQRPDEATPAAPSGNADEAEVGIEVVGSAAPAPQSAAADHQQLSGVAAPTEVKPDALPSLRPAILSERTGRQVASSFRELNDILETNRRKSLDQLAEEMLRPMLQEWLDNNLPQLVERLVREEIERIARGA